MWISEKNQPETIEERDNNYLIQHHRRNNDKIKELGNKLTNNLKISNMRKQLNIYRIISPASLKKKSCIFLLVTSILVLLLSSTKLSLSQLQQPHQQPIHDHQRGSGNSNCGSANSLTSFICKAGQTVFGGATRLASNLLNRPNHWGVPDSERLEVEDDYNANSHSNNKLNHNNHRDARQHLHHGGHNGQVGPRPPIPANHPPINDQFNDNDQHPQRHRPHQNDFNSHEANNGDPIVIDENYLRGYGHKKHRRAEGALGNAGANAGAQQSSLACSTFDNGPGVCVPMPVCYHKYGNSIKYRMDDARESCPRGHALICCPIKRNTPTRVDSDDDREDADDNPNERRSLLRMAAEQQKKAGKIAIDTLRELVSQVFHESHDPKHRSEQERNNELERNIISEGFTLKRDSPSDLHQRFIQLRNSKLVTKLAKDGSDFLEIATRLMKQQQQQEFNNSKEACTRHVKEIDGGTTIVIEDSECSRVKPPAAKPVNRRVWLPEIDFSQTDLSARCPGDPICPPGAVSARYRTHDGSCNNLIHTAWGKSHTPYTRILPPDYEDGVNELRSTGVTGAPLPNPRRVSLASVDWSDKADQKASLMLMQWGQFIDHDFSLAATTPMLTPEGQNIDCCNRRLLTDPIFKHPACISVLLPDLDPFYSRFKVGCMNMVRNAPSPPIGCRLRAREQLNQLTHFIDGSMVYGNDDQQAIGLRQMRGGLLKSSRINGAEFLPFDGRLGEGCVLPSEGIRRGMRCFVAGDNRVNELTGLVTTHAMFLREHNRVARILGLLNRDWSDEKIYQETRRIVIAEIQHITYNEFLPLILGPVVMRDFQLELSQTLATDLYDPETDPTIINEFAGAAYRLHSLVQSAFNFQTEEGNLIQQFRLRYIFNNPASLYREGNYDGCIHSMVNDPSQSLDNHFTQELTNHLFQDTNSSFGMDLVTVNIQRGRDHGIPGYNFFRQACGLSKIKSFEQLDVVMVEGAGRVFSNLYAHVDDIDLFIAGSYEKKLKDAMVGPVFACIIGEQFRRLKTGDRYWYENGQQAGSFTANQLAQLKRVSMARIICDNSDFIERMQPLAFLRPTDWNPKVPCEHLPWLDLRAWAVPARRGPNIAIDTFGPSEPPFRQPHSDDFRFPGGPHFIG